MAGETVITVVGNLTADPELRFTPNGAAVANFTIASTPRTFDRQTNEWKDGETLFLRASIWREAAENVAETLTKGTRVVAQGRLKARTYDDREGNKRTSYELDVDEIGPSLKYATAKVTRSQRGGGGGGFGGGQQGGGFGGPQQGGSGFGGNAGGGSNDGGFGGGQQSGGQQGGGWGGQQGGANAAPQDPWAGSGGGGGWDTPSSNEPPF
ncbi:single-stranded DNA-binding protein [Micrococcus sp. EYE_162]|uniref:single-stranded DNA-binding protein n=1 Tax=unclassified Micrococcus TaxID=2620948 RepID=UPI002004F00E|nr:MULTISPECIES: single-stranded DNA-binding protein [unclassified Micrococcus]MCK6095578.1 single-stranded DNA-binding protein [Micrococcus sp. EYE_212]MCK6171653.1 single-stranded DNA-binding protein [Micrococcus sp. EYE_162]